MQQEDLRCFEAKGMKLTPELLERVRAETPGNQAAEMVPADIDLHRPLGVQGKRLEGERAEVKADGAASPLGAQDQRLRFAHRQSFQAVGAVGLTADIVPVAMLFAAPAARHTR